MSVSVFSRGVPAGLLACVGALCAALVIWAGVFVSGAFAAGANCPNEAFRIGPSAGLPDCRAYELVSPPDKNGGEVDGGVNDAELAAPEQAAVDGEAITYGSSSAFTGAEPLSSVVTSQYVSTRTAGGWRTRGVTPTQELPEGRTETAPGVPDFSLFQGFNQTLSSGFLLAWNPQPDPSAPQGFYNPYIFEADSGSYRLLSSVTPPAHSATEPVYLWLSGFGVVYAGMSADGRHVIFEANDALTPNAVPGRNNLYEWSAGEPLELVSVLPQGPPYEGKTYEEGQESPLAFEGSLRFGDAPVEGIEGLSTSGYPFNYSDVLSSDGRRAFWTAGGKIYMHELASSGSRTVEVSASQRTGEPGHGKYWTASSSGSLVYFTSSEQLTTQSSVSGEDLYAYDTETGALHDLTVAGGAGEAAEVQGVLGAGEAEGVSRVYFVAHGVLAQGAVEGAENLYVAQIGGGESTTNFIATLGKVEAEQTDFDEAVMARTSRVSPNGRSLAFQSTRPLTGYDNIPVGGPCPPPEHEGNMPTYKNEEGRCMEVFEYEAQLGRLACASCDTSGLPPTGPSLVPETPHLFSDVYGWESSTVQQRYLLDDGRLFFDSSDALLPQASNGRLNVYEYEPEGVGQCVGSTSGCLYLISTGTSASNSYFADAGADGRDVFLLTRQQLVGEDGDEAVDMYDAREEGGFSAAQVPPCGGEACKPALVSAPAIYGAPTSATFNGPGNPSVPAPVQEVAPHKATAKKRRHRRRRPRERAHKGTRVRPPRKRRAGYATGSLGRAIRRGDVR